MRVLFIGNFVPEEYSLEISANSLAGNRFQNNFFNNICKYVECDIASFIAVPLTDVQRKKVESLNCENKWYFTKGKNIFKSILQFRKKIKQNKDRYDAIVCYNIAYPWLFITNIFKRKKTVLILADFSDTKSYKNILLKLYAYICRKNIRKFDYVIGLSKETKNLLKRNQKFIYMPGGIELNSFKDIKLPKLEKKLNILYSGNISQVTGVDLLIDAIDNIKDNYHLYITGRGELENKLINSKNKNINYLGSLPYKEYLDVLAKANIVVNPRNMFLPENTNNFPSKIFDYLASGKVVVSTKFIGYEDFLDNFYFCESNINSLKETIEKSMKEYKEKYKHYFKKNIEKSKEFDWNTQIKKIIKEINGSDLNG